ncbi:hypothetical protein MP228_009394 [Amoeboaphelidium protococcarum]|nr:hypothetical protein MP228_009394 [Amoeboaphelidium protococcarum]
MSVGRGKFKVIAENVVRDLKVTQLQHPCGAQMVNIHRIGQNGVSTISEPQTIALGFGTPVSDGRGVAHILEHTVLCGSRKFPVRDPFFNMMNRSMSTYMNAWTFNDYTIYPFSSLQRKDLDNLLAVYMDATLDPLLKESDFRQEGWRLEKRAPPASSTTDMGDYEFKGVVFNEMKGVLSNSNHLFYYKQMEHLFDGVDIRYSVNSGGDPYQIPLLKYKDLVDFHRLQYSPSRMKLFTFGQYPLQEQLPLIEDLINQYSAVRDSSNSLRDNSLAALNQNVINDGKHKLWQSGRTIQETFQYDQMSGPIDQQLKYSCSWIMKGFHTDNFIQDRFNLSIMSSLLFDGQSAPFYKSLLDAKLGKEFSAGSGISDFGPHFVFSAGVVDGKSGGGGEVEVQSAIMNTLDHCSKDLSWCSQQRVDALLHQILLRNKMPKRDFGISVTSSVISDMLYGLDVPSDLDIDSKVTKFKEMFDGGRLFSEYIRSSLLDNKHSLQFVMNPSENYNQELRKKEDQLLQQVSANVKDFAQIDSMNLQLTQEQNQVPNVDVLPKIEVKDASTEVIRYPVDIKKISKDIPVQTYVGATNDLSFFKLLFPLNGRIDSQLRMYLPLYCALVQSLGTSSVSGSDFEELIKRYTGGVSMSPFIACKYDDQKMVQDALVLSTLYLPENMDKAFDILLDIMKNVNIDNTATVQTISSMIAANLSSGVSNSGHAYAKSNAQSKLGVGKYLESAYDGLKYVSFMNQVAQQDISATVNFLKQVKSILSGHDQSMQCRASLHCASEDLLQDNLRHVEQLSLQAGLCAQDESGVFQNVNNYTAEVLNDHEMKEWFKLPFNTSFTAACYKLHDDNDEDAVDFLSKQSLAIQLLSQILSRKHIHKEIREKGGAYGSSCSFDATHGILSFTSYRDAQPLKSLETFDNTVSTCDQFVTANYLEEAKIAMLSSLDQPLKVNEYGQQYFINRVSDDVRQKRRDLLLSTSIDDLHQAAQRLKRNHQKVMKSAQTVLSGSLDEQSIPKEFSIKSL